jgi:hypothetical protein
MAILQIAATNVNKDRDVERTGVHQVEQIAKSFKTLSKQISHCRLCQRQNAQTPFRQSSSPNCGRIKCRRDHPQLQSTGHHGRVKLDRFRSPGSRPTGALRSASAPTNYSHPPNYVFLMTAVSPGGPLLLIVFCLQVALRWRKARPFRMPRHVPPCQPSLTECCSRSISGATHRVCW